MIYSKAIENEITYCYSNHYVVGAYLYMGMGKINNHTVCIAIGYKIDYCYKKAAFFASQVADLTFTHINKVKVGELEACQKFEIQ